MKWRCTWCGKPHAENDPPCDNCGHNAFEKAIVREGEEATDSATGTVDTGPDYVWRCPNCGRDHVRNNPPCSRCGNPELEKAEQTYDDVDRDLDAPGWLEVAKPYAPVVLVVGLVVALFATGIIPLEILPGIGAPSSPEMPDAPGEGSEAAGIDLEATEREVHERLEAERDHSRRYDDDLAAYAEYNNRALVAIEYDETNAERVDPGDFGADCGGEVLAGRAPIEPSIDDYGDEGELAADVAAALASIDAVTASGYAAEGMDLHVVDGTVYAYYAAC